MAIILTSVKKTCLAFPSQWEGRTERNSPVWIRYRFGRLKVKEGEPREDIYGAVNGETLFDAQLGDEWDGVISWAEAATAADIEIV